MTFQTSKMLPVDMNINFILAHFEQRSKKIRGPMFSVFFMEKNETVRRKIPEAHVIFVTNCWQGKRITAIPCYCSIVYNSQDMQTI